MNGCVNEGFMLECVLKNLYINPFQTCDKIQFIFAYIAYKCSLKRIYKIK